jgi:integrase
MAGKGRPGPNPDKILPAWERHVMEWTREMQAARFTAGTIRVKVSYIRQLSTEHPDWIPETVTRGDLLEHIASHTEWKHNTAKSARAAFRSFFQSLQDRGHRSDDPTEKLPVIRTPRGLPRPCPDESLTTGLANAETRTQRLALTILAETGLRRAEVASLRPDQVEGRPGAYALRVRGKGGHVRLVPIRDELADLILAVRTKHVFPSPERPGQPLTADYIGRLVTRALPGGWTAHTLRHRFATRAYQATKDIRAVQELMGHVSPTTTAIYTKADDNAMRTAAAAAAVPQLD